ncbi:MULTISPECIES: ATP-binding protein [unclassified Streptomyces]|uniref:ATP-binding protein n=1 Tax=unclassified Streptomyces TaxID=2593676 RepID=UPI0035E02ADE
MTEDNTAQPEASRLGTDEGLPTTAADARTRVQEQITSKFGDVNAKEVDAQVLGAALLVTSELVINAIRHGGGLNAFDMLVTGDALFLSVADASTRLPVSVDPADRDRGRIGGFGWPLICGLARHVAITPQPHGKQITILIPLT